MTTRINYSIVPGTQTAIHVGDGTLIPVDGAWPDEMIKTAVDLRAPKISGDPDDLRDLFLKMAKTGHQGAIDALARLDERDEMYRKAFPTIDRSSLPVYQRPSSTPQRVKLGAFDDGDPTGDGELGAFRTNGSAGADDGKELGAFVTAGRAPATKRGGSGRLGAFTEGDEQLGAFTTKPKTAAREIAAMGPGDDTELIHINKGEIDRIEEALGFKGRENPETGLLSFDPYFALTGDPNGGWFPSIDRSTLSPYAPSGTVPSSIKNPNDPSNRIADILRALQPGPSSGYTPYSTTPLDQPTKPRDAAGDTSALDRLPDLLNGGIDGQIKRDTAAKADALSAYNTRVADDKNAKADDLARQVREHQDALIQGGVAPDEEPNDKRRRTTPGSATSRERRSASPRTGRRNWPVSAHKSTTATPSCPA